MPCSLLDGHQCFIDTFYLHFQGIKTGTAGSSEMLTPIYQSTYLHGIMSQMTLIIMPTTLRTTDLTLMCISCRKFHVLIVDDVIACDLFKSLKTLKDLWSDE
jgi:hypothetical protein